MFKTPQEGQAIVTVIAWFGKICVAIYAFISGYGMRVKAGIEEPSNNIVKELLTGYRYIIRKIMTFMVKYWVVFLIFVPILFAVHIIKWTGIQLFLLNLVGLKFDYNGAWWYVRQYLLMLVAFPIIDYLYARIKISQRLIKLLVIAAMGIMIVGYYLPAISVLHNLADSNTIIYLFIFTEGYLCARLDFFKNIDDKMPNRLKYLVVCCILLLCIIIRVILAKDAGYCIIDIAIIIPFVYSIGSVIRNVFIIKVMKVFSKYSTFMWLVHCFYIGQSGIMKSIEFIDNPIAIYIELIAVSVITSVTLAFVEKAIFTIISAKVKTQVMRKEQIG